MNKQKALIHIGAGYMQLPGIKYAKSIGLHVVVTDKNDKAPGIEFADQYERLDGTDIASFTELAYDISKNYELVGAFSSSDYGLLTIATLNEEFSLPGVGRQSVMKALNKSVSQDIWRNKGLSVPPGVSVSNLDDLNKAGAKVGYPLIIKPSDSCGSQGVKSVSKAAYLQEAYLEASTFSSQVLVEKLINGHHCDVNGFFSEGHFYPCGVMDRYFSDLPFCYPIYGMQPSQLIGQQEDEVYGLLESAARLLGIEVGPVKADMIYTTHGPVLLEIAPRFHGDVVTQHVTPYAIGFNPVEAWIATLAGQREDLSLKYNQYAGWWALFSGADGIVESVQGVDDAMKIPGVRDVFVTRKPGDLLRPSKDNTAVCGFIWAASDDAESLSIILRRAADMINFNVGSSGHL